MKLRNILQWSILGLILVGVTLGVSIYSALHRYTDSIEKAEAANRIVMTIIERRLLADDYAAAPGQRAAIQWYIKQAQIEQLVRQHTTAFSSPDETMHVAAIRERLVTSRETFDEIVRFHVVEASQNTAHREKLQRLTTNLTVRAQESILAASKLLNINNARRDASLNQIVRLFSSAAVLFFGLLIASFAVIMRSANRLDHAQARDQAILSSIGEGLIVTDETGRILVMNPAAERILGWRQQEAINRPITKALRIFDERGKPVDDQHRPIYKALTKGEFISSDKYQYLKHDGSLLPVEIAVTPFRLNGSIIGVIDLFHDITERNKIDKMKSDFVSLVSHQLKTPVGIIRGYIENMLAGLTGPLNQRQQQYLERMRDTSIRNFQLIADLLNVSRIERGVIAIDLQPAAVDDIVNAAVDEYRAKIQSLGLTLKLEGLGRGLIIMADGPKLTEAIKNSINNALKFTTKGSLTIRIREERECVVVDVIDTGSGMGPDAMSKLFTRDKVLSGSPSPEGSTGLGLYIAKNFMQLQHGDLTATSREGYGSTFTFKIPKK